MVPPAIDAAVEAQKRKIEALKEAVGLVEQEKQAVQAQEQAYNNSVKITDARLNAEGQINKLQGQILQRAYEQAGSAQQRLNIAKQIFQNEINGAKIAYQQTINSIKAEQQRLVFRREAAVIEAKIIEAQGRLAAAKEKDIEKSRLILQETRNAVQAQQENVSLIDSQIKAQGQIAQHQITAADAVLKQATLAAQAKLEQTLLKDEIVKSKTEANKLSTEIANSSTSSGNLATSTGQVSNNASNAAVNFIRVATNADMAANAIFRAAAAQRSLNAAQSSGGGGGGGGDVTSQAQGGYNLGSFTPFARGGVVKGPTLGLIGEGGEPEYIIPQSKAAGFAMNFLSGKRGASAIPGFAEGGMAVPSTASVNIQTGPVTQMGGQDFVTTEELSSAVQAGVEQTLDILRRDQMTRSSMGLN